MKKGAAQTIRIIAGQWRGRRLPVLDAPGLRPSKDAVRETLFNWLAPDLPGARCLDLFAGTGALGLEAASRGAAEVLLVEKDSAVAAQLQRNADSLQAQGVRVHKQSAEDYLAQLAGKLDIVFLDPPFALDVLPRLLPALVDKLAADGAIYIEQDRSQGLPALPEGWYYHREKRAGQVVFGLARKKL
ncbi:MAG: 16S rRNA (guanine(966)-N(2))-methyltransferase RsmD [Gammaproteobacteria bacterium]|nr:MAG: 16S rRNA (guanine(966)-N(2))-methyltransferase RsmD [Gammaproteobacteria bacterium]